MTVRKLSRKQKVALCDDLFSRYIRRRDGHCRRCGKDYDLQAAHIFSRSYWPIRYDEANCMALCRADHVFFTFHGIEWERFVRAEIGDQEYEDLQRRGTSGLKVDYDAVLNWLRTEAA